MADSVGQIGLDLVVNQNGFNKQMQGISGLAKKAGLALAGAFAVTKIVDFSAQCIKLGSDLNEVQNVVDVTFGSMSSKVNEFAKNAAASFGLSETMAKKFTGTFGAMAKAFGFSEKAAYDMGTSLTGLAGDVASFYNLSQDEAYTKLKSVFTGETESLKDLGVVMTQAALDQYALANGYGKTTAKMSEAEKVALRYAFVQKQLSLASGDFIRTSGSWANQVRILKLQFDSLKASIGQGLINALTPVIKFLNLLISKLQIAADAFNSFTSAVFGKTSKAAQSVSTSVDGISDATSSAVSGIGDTAQATSDAAKKAASTATSLDELNIVSKDSSSDSGGTGAGTGAIDSALGDIASSAKTDVETPLSKAFDTIIAKVKELGNIFKASFLDQLKLADFSGIQTGFDNIKTALSKIFSDVDLTNAASVFMASLASALGAALGAMVAIGTNIASNIVQGIGNYLTENAGFISGALENMFRSGTQFAGVISDVSALLASISTILTGPTAIQITTDLFTIFGNGFLTAVDLGTQFGTDLISAIVQPITSNESLIKTAIEKTLSPIGTAVGAVKTTCDTAFSGLYTSYNTYVKPALDYMSAGFSTVFATALTAYNTYLAPAIQLISDGFSTLMTEHISPLILAFEDLAGSIVLNVAKIWDETLAPFIAWAIVTLAPPFSEAFGTIGTVIEGAAGILADAITGILKSLSSFTTWIGDNQGIIVGVTTTIASFFAAWKVIELMSFIQQSGGVVAAITSLVAPLATATTAILTNAAAFVTNTGAKLADKAETMILTAMYAKDFVVSVASGTAALVTQAAQWLISTGLKIADTVATIASTVATTAATVATWAFNAALAVLTSPITLVIGAIAGLIAIGVLLYQNWDVISAKATEIFEYVASWITEKFTEAGDFITKKWNEIKDYFSKKLDEIKTLFSTIIGAISSFLSTTWDSISKKISEIWDGIKSALSTTLDTISSKFTSVFEGIRDSVSKVFGQLWDNIKGFINSILSGIETMANGVVGGINKVINSLNSLKIDVPDWVTDMTGIKAFGFSIPNIPTVQLPRLAQGGYVKANTPQLAMIGDNMTQGEIVAPEDKMLDMALTAAKMAAGSGTGSSELFTQMILLLKQILDAILGIDFTAEVDGRTLITMIKNLNSRSGVSMES